LLCKKVFFNNVFGKKKKKYFFLLFPPPPPPENRAVYGIMWKNLIQLDRQQMTV